MTCTQICDNCKKVTCVIYITTEHKKLCPECYDEIVKKRPWNWRIERKKCLKTD